MRHHLAFVLVVACACGPKVDSSATKSPADGTAPPVSTPANRGAPTASTGPRPAPIARLQAGATPNSNTHRWGQRSYDVRKAGAWQVRLHDQVSFQGTGMTPGDMSGPRHLCTAWEPLPEALAKVAADLRLGEVEPLPTGVAPPNPPPDDARDCDATRALCDGIAKLLGDAQKPHPPARPDEATKLDLGGGVTGSCDR